MYKVNMDLQSIVDKLSDFSDLNPRHVRSMYENELTLGESQNNLTNSDHKLLEKFKQLRLKNRQLQSQNDKLKEQLIMDNQRQKKYQDQIQMWKTKYENNQQAWTQAKPEMDQVHTYIDQLNQKNNQLLQTIKHQEQLQNKYERQLEQSLFKIEQLQLQKDKINEISIAQKIELEDRIAQLEKNQEVDKLYLSQIEFELSKTKDKCKSIENKFQIIQNSYYDSKASDSQYSKYPSTNSIISELTRQNDILKSQVIQQKQKRLRMEHRMFEQQQFCSLYSTQIYNLQKQLAGLRKKNKTVNKSLYNENMTQTIRLIKKIIQKVKKCPHSKDVQHLVKLIEVLLMQIGNQTQQSSISKSNTQSLLKSTKSPSMFKQQKMQQPMFSPDKPIQQLSTAPLKQQDLATKSIRSVTSFKKSGSRLPSSVLKSPTTIQQFSNN